MPWSIMLKICVLALLGYAAAGKVETRQHADCENHCDMRKCPVVNKETCDGHIVKDACDCCPHCEPQPAGTTSTVIPSPAATTNATKCKDVVCPKLKICMVNMQGLPLCRCPSVYVCNVMRPVCGRDGKTYFSRCHIRISACNRGRKIPLSHRGECEGNKININKLTVKQRRLYFLYMKKHGGKTLVGNKYGNRNNKPKNTNQSQSPNRRPVRNNKRDRRIKKINGRRKVKKNPAKKNGKKRKNMRKKFRRIYRMRY